MKSFASSVPTKAMRTPENPVRRACYKLVRSTAFDSFITTVIVANIGVMACDYWGIEQVCMHASEATVSLCIFIDLSHLSHLVLGLRRTRRCSLPIPGAWTSSA